MTRAPTICNEPGCPNFKPCPEHTPKPWESSRRRERTLTSGSRQQKRARYILDRDNGICHVCGKGGANEADHVIPVGEGGADHISNMAAIHGKGTGLPCHDEKTQQEAQRAKVRTEHG